MNKKITWLGIALMTIVLGLSFAIAACGGGTDASDDANGQVADTEHEDGDDHDADAMDMDDEADAEANAHLEAAPKDALYLVQMTNFAFTPNVLEVKAGDVLEIAVQNVEPILHDFTIDKIDADVHVSFLEGTGEHAHATAEIEADVHFPLSEPGTGVVHLQVHEPGEYRIYCTVPGHAEAGMVATLIVTEGDHDDDAADDGHTDGDEHDE